MHNGLVVVTWQLVDHNEGDGGLVRSPSYASAHHRRLLSNSSCCVAVVIQAVVPGTHKGNISAPQSMRAQEMHMEFVKQPVTKAGDVIIFTEATTVRPL
jgi:hypothetical protein